MQFEGVGAGTATSLTLGALLTQTRAHSTKVSTKAIRSSKMSDGNEKLSKLFLVQWKEQAHPQEWSHSHGFQTFKILDEQTPIRIWQSIYSINRGNHLKVFSKTNPENHSGKQSFWKMLSSERSHFRKKSILVITRFVKFYFQKQLQSIDLEINLNSLFFKYSWSKCTLKTKFCYQ